ncbi:MAG: fused MFS/spermidine synthase, partial [Deltaproteobacteria bacterium]
ETFAEQFWLFLMFEFFIAAAVMIVPTLSMGAIFPLVNRIYTQGFSQNIGEKVGNVYFFNTTGAIVGSIAGGFIFIPLIGVQNGVVLTAALNILISIILLYYSRIRQVHKYIGAAAFAAVFGFMVIVLPPWEKISMTMGLYINPYGKDMGKPSFKERNLNERLLYYKEGLNAIITVRGAGPNAEIISYQANGKQEARSEFGR